MTWWAWTLLWVLLVLGSLGVFALLARSLWRKAAALFSEFGTAADRFEAVATQLDALGERVSARQEPAVFADPVQLRRERQAQARRRASDARRRAARR